jgi:putative transposase
MGRPHRVVEPGGLYHVTTRGSNRGTIVWDDCDIRALLALLELTAGRFNWRVLAYCVMTNHYHLLLRVPSCGLSEGMQLLNGSYSRRVGKRYGRDRHLFANRFGAEHVETRSHLLEAARYLPLNPVLAGLCEAPEDWPWSSYRATIGLAFPPPFLAVEEIRGLFGSRPGPACAAYRSFVAEGLVRARRARVSDTDGGLPLRRNRQEATRRFATGSSL